MEKLMNFEDIRPYHDEEVNEALKRIGQVPEFFKAVQFIFPEMTENMIATKLQNISTTFEFQRDFMHKGIRRILKDHSDGLTYDGFEFIDPNEAYLYLSNHRDIFLDSGILEILLFEHGIDTTEITFGSNLMSTPFLTDVGKVNKMFTVYREGTARERYKNSQRLSAYIRHTINDKRQSVWIAQKNGRAKDGNDQTHPGVLKMLNSSGEEGFVENFQQLNIVPLTISYEFEPCDRYKVRELYQTRYLQKNYEKEPGEDLKSIVDGVIGDKGRVHMSVGMPLGGELPGLEGIPENNERINQLASMVDASIHDNYKRWPTNYIAADLLRKESKYGDQYDDRDKMRFMERKEKVLSSLEGDPKALEEIFYRIYANPVINWEDL